MFYIESYKYIVVNTDRTESSTKLLNQLAALVNVISNTITTLTDAFPPLIKIESTFEEIEISQKSLIPS